MLWDVDHTLIEIRGVGRTIYQRAFLATTGKSLATLVSISGRTELAIMAESLRINDIELTGELEVFDLARYLDAGAYGDDDPERLKLVAIAQRRATERTGVLLDNDATVLIGDTPQDVKVGLGAGVRVIGVATGKTSTPDLRNVGAHHVATNLAECHAILNGLAQGIRNE